MPPTPLQRVRRQADHLSLRQLHRLSGVALSRLSLIDQAPTPNMTIETLGRLAPVFQMPRWELLKALDEPSQ